MFNIFLQKSFLKPSISFTLILLMLFSAGGYIMLYPKPATASLATSALQLWQGIIARIQGAWTRIQIEYGNAAAWISATLDQWQRADTILVRATYYAAQIALLQIINMMTNQVITWIQGGGTPRFITNWGGFFSDALDKAGGKFIDEFLGMGYLCSPIDIDIKIALLDVKPFEERVRCTLSDMGNNLDNFINDFSVGGWAEWIKLTEPQNNLYGAYFMADFEKNKKEEEALAEASAEANAGLGFLSPKECVRGHALVYVNPICLGVTALPNPDECYDKDGCDDLESITNGNDCLNFTCVEKKIVTPGSVLSDMTSEIINAPFKKLNDMVSELSDDLGPAGPYIMAIGNALINRLITEGLSSLQATGPTIDNPNTPLPPGTIITPPETPAQAIIDQGNAIILLGQQELLKENLETELLPQQEKNLDIMQDIENIRTEIIITLNELQSFRCYMPFTADSIPSISGQITDMQNDVIETNQWIADTATTISSINGYVLAIDEYIELYNNTLQPFTEEEQIALNLKRELMETAKNIVINDAQTSAHSTSDNLIQLTSDTQNINMEVVQTGFNLQMACGFDETCSVEQNTLYCQKVKYQNKLNQAESALDDCLWEEEYYD